MTYLTLEARLYAWRFKGKFFSEGAVEMLKHHHTNLTFLKHLIPVYNSNITLIYVHAYKTSSLWNSISKKKYVLPLNLNVYNAWKISSDKYQKMAL